MAEVATAGSRGAEGASLPELPLPDQKTKGWEFTDLSGLELDAYDRGDGEIDGLDDRARRRRASRWSCRSPRPPSSHAELLEQRLGSLVPAEDPFVARNEAGWTRRASSSTCPAGKRLERADPDRGASSSARQPRSTGAR